MILFSADFPTRITPAGVNVQGKSAAIALELEPPHKTGPFLIPPHHYPSQPGTGPHSLPQQS
jgi:hypothetical protein